MFVNRNLCRGDQEIRPVLHAEELFLELRKLPVAVMLVRFTMKAGEPPDNRVGRMEGRA